MPDVTEQDGSTVDQNATTEKDGAASPEGATSTADGETTEETATNDVAEFDVNNLSKDDDGNLVWVVDPENPKSTVYKGKTLDEVLSKAAKGIKDKDTYISKLKVGKISADSHKITASGTMVTDAPIKFPTQAEIAAQVISEYKQLGLEPEMLNWNDDKWREYELEKGALAALKKTQVVEAARNEIGNRYANVNVAQINNSILDDETEAVQELLEEYGVDPDEDGFDYTEILNAVNADDKNKRSNGVLKNGRILREAEKVIRQIAKEKEGSTISKKVAEQQAKAKLEREKAGSTESASRTKTIGADKSKAPASSEAALQEVLKEMQAGKKFQ